MKFVEPSNYTGNKAWDALDVAEIEGATVRLHWTDQPYKWHQNDGDEVFVVLNGKVKMFYRSRGVEQHQIMKPGDIFHAGNGDEHVAHPLGEARVLVIEKKGSI
ncbi:cupin [Kiloniella antarctica]|uniref:Cupin n=1 Tax=Kiloniella antarctica TaxID=1550907 RepID=A0ABW5BGE3_9PROT